MVNNVEAELSAPIHVRFARTKIATLDRVAEEAVNAVAVVPIILRGVDSALGGDVVSPAGSVLVRKAADVIALLTKSRRRGSTGQAGTNDEDGYAYGD